MQSNCLFYHYTAALADRLKILTVALLCLRFSPCLAVE